MPDFSITRRAALLATPAILMLGQGRAAELKKVSFTLPFLPEGPNLIAFVAKANGYWSEEGLDVDIARGFGSVAAAQAIGAGRFDYGMAAAPAGLQQSAKGLKLIQIACCSYDSMMGITVIADSQVHKATDLAGKKIASTATSGEYPLLPAYAQATGLDLSTVTVSSLFPVAIGSLTGLRAADPGQLRLCQGLQASIFQVFFHIRVPTAMPYAFAGAKVAATLAFTGAVVAEFISSNAGLGHVVMNASSQSDTALVFAALAVLCAIGAALYGVVVLAERHARRRWGRG